MIDIDGVLAAFVPAFKAESFKLLGKPEDLTVEQKVWDFECLGLTQAEVTAVWRVIKATPNWWIKLGKMPGTTGLYPAYAEGLILPYFVTHRVPTQGKDLEDQCAEWISNNYGIKWPNVIVSPQKGKVCAALGIEHAIDDKPENCQDLLDSGIPNVFIKDASYNREFEYGALRRVSDLNMFLELI